ncbi:MAG: hypothetical protein EZS28_004193 [Streblomastix strix]|uniref:Uncharacterized protein n=1 Tax=Streblomastix strix TaxID=222440 RepID=A0A5J4WZ69_9EUKA|nr:MAG: hypothetical protein EZS28_004193 [Streblomastix strix]
MRHQSKTVKKKQQGRWNENNRYNPVQTAGKTASRGDSNYYGQDGMMREKNSIDNAEQSVAALELRDLQATDDSLILMKLNLSDLHVELTQRF